MTKTSSDVPRLRIRSWLPDALGVLWVLAAAFAVLLPALVHGSSLGPYDFLSQFGLTQQRGVVVHNGYLYDQIATIIPWTTLAWTQVHHGLLPLWNPYSALGMPLAFNWQSAVFSLPALVGYLFPAHLDYTVQVVFTLVIAGTGAYVLGRVLHLGVLGSAMAGIVFELSGPFIAWLGFDPTFVMAWAGWLFTAVVLIFRGRRRVRAGVLFAACLAAAMYGGQPEILVLLGLAIAVFVAILLASRSRRLHGSGPVLRPLGDLALATTSGLALSAPVVLPSLQMIGASWRDNNINTSSNVFSHALPLHNLINLVAQGFYGLPVGLGGSFFGDVDYPELAAYVGTIAIVLAVVGLVFTRRRPEVIGFGAVSLAAAATVFVPPVVAFLVSFPKIGPFVWIRALFPMAFAISILAGVGTDVLVRSHRRAAVRRWAATGFGVAILALGAVWLFGRGHLPPNLATLRTKSLLWPLVEAVVGLAAVLALARVDRRRPSDLKGQGEKRALRWGRGAALCLVACETVFLVAAGAPIPASSPTFFKPTQPVVALKHAVGSSLVGFGKSACTFPPPSVGVLTDVNIVYGIREFTIYDPTIPRDYFLSWHAVTGEKMNVGLGSGFCPDITSARVARLYGIGFVLEPPGAPPPSGAVFDRHVGDETLYRIPGAAEATLTPLASNGVMPTADAVGTPVAVTHPDPASWKLVTDTPSPQVLRLRLTDAPGWHASLDGRPLKLDSFSKIMLQARIPGGEHTIELHYWPTAFTVGLVFALCSTLSLLGAMVYSSRWRRLSRSHDRVRPG